MVGLEYIMVRFSLVIPAYNEELLLGRLLESVNLARVAYRGEGEIQVIVADNMSTDRTSEVAKTYDCQVVVVTKRVIAAARNGGASAANGDFICFVDADSVIHTQTFNVLDAAIKKKNLAGGATGVVFERWSPGTVATYLCFVPLVWLLRIDTGVVFFDARAFIDVEGYPEEMMFAEDVAMMLRVRRWGRTRGRFVRQVRGAKTITSTRKFDQYGDWHYFSHMLGIAWRFLRGLKSDKFAHQYWYQRKSSSSKKEKPATRKVENPSD